MIINYRSERLDITIGHDRLTAVYERLEVDVEHSQPQASDPIPVGPITTDTNEVTS